MKAVKILDGQTIIDIAAQELGDLERSYEIAQMNGMNLTDELTAGEMIDVPDADISKRNIISLFADEANAPASDTPESSTGILEGIDYWIIENDFIVQ